MKIRLPEKKRDGFFACPAPAKINRSLHITGRREDGYHLLDSIFCLIDLCDTVWIKPRFDHKIILHENPIGIEDNLIFQAAKALQQASNTTQGAEIRLEKHIPTGGGLGGGSSDAATTLMTLNALWQSQLNQTQLMQLGLNLGADVPFFLSGSHAQVRGIGEIITPISLPKQWYVIINPQVHVCTGDIFRQFDLTEKRKTSIIRSLENGTGGNDLQAVVCAKHPEVAQALDLLNQFGHAQMSGSGACVFLATKTQKEAQHIFQAVQHKAKAYCISELNQHPLIERNTGESSSG